MTTLETIATDALWHFTSGMTVSFLDYTTYRVANHKEDRLSRKAECLEAMTAVLAANAKDITSEASTSQTVESTDMTTVANNQDSMQYALNVDIVKQYLIDEGIAKKDIQVSKRVKSFFRGLVKEERINNLSPTGKLGVAVGLEVLYDSMLGFFHYSSVREMTPIAAFGTNIYQIPAFWTGLMVGNVLKKGYNAVSTSSKEKKLNSTLKDMQRKTPILDLVFTYEPSHEVKEQLSAQGISTYQATLSGAGKRLYAQLGKGFDHISGAVTGYSAERKKQAEEEKAQLKERFHKHIDGR